MKVDRRLVVFAIAEATSHFFHHPNLAVQSFGGGVGDTMSKIGQDVSQVSLQGLGRAHHWSQAGVRGPEIPTAKVVRHPAGDNDSSSTCAAIP